MVVHRGDKTGEPFVVESTKGKRAQGWFLSIRTAQVPNLPLSKFCSDIRRTKAGTIQLKFKLSIDNKITFEIVKFC